MIVIRRNGEQMTVRGWRAWLLYGIAALFVALAVVLLFSLFLGIALTIVTFFLLGLPLAIVLALALRLFRPKPIPDPRIIDHEPLPPRRG